MICIHHWVIEGQGSAGTGTCKHCGEEKTFNPDPDMRGAYNWKDSAVRGQAYETTRGFKARGPR